ncbi:MAG: amino acid ABC transporter permease [Pseudomonadota bacterium]
MSDISFVQKEQIPPSPPPASEAGVTKWLRENLFNGFSGTLLTAISLVAIYYILSAAVPWLFFGVWSLDTLDPATNPMLSGMENSTLIQRCRVVLEGTGGGCFAVIDDRWRQLLYGFYPADQIWRINLAFLLLFVAIAPVLFNAVPRQLFAFTAVFPFVAYWLIWGGTIWGPISTLAGFALWYVVFRLIGDRSFVLGLIGGAFAGIIWWLFIGGAVAGGLSSVLPIGLESVESRDIGGFTTNFVIGLTSIAFSLPLGILLALGRQSNLFIIKGICVVFIEFIRGVPLITLLFVASVILAFFLPPGTNFDLFLRVIIMVTMFSAAYIAEVIRGGLAALPRGQYEAADAMGLDYWQAIRLIIMPQALKISIPGIVNVFIGLFKDTTLVSVISMFDMVGFIRGPLLSSTDWNGIYWELFAFASLLFFIFCYGISQYSQYLERKLATDHR